MATLTPFRANATAFFEVDVILDKAPLRQHADLNAMPNILEPNK